MLLKRNENSTKDLLLYNLNEKKYIGVHVMEDGRVEKIRLFDENIGGDCLLAEYEATAIVFPACFTVKYDEYLSTELLTVWEDAFEAVYEA